MKCKRTVILSHKMFRQFIFLEQQLFEEFQQNCLFIWSRFLVSLNSSSVLKIKVRNNGPKSVQSIAMVCATHDFYRIWRLQMAKNSQLLEYVLCNEANIYTYQTQKNRKNKKFSPQRPTLGSETISDNLKPCKNYDMLFISC